ncbi:hypothetical protein SRHO_G00039780 [Serrasalmus rhombeus]
MNFIYHNLGTQLDLDWARWESISDIHVTGESEDMTAKERLLLWSQQMTEGYVGVRCDNFTTSWRDGRLFNALIHKYRPDLVDMSKVSAQSTRSNLEHAFCVAEQLGVARLLDPEDVDVSSPDEKSVITYVSTLYDVFPKVPEGVEGISANDVDIKWVEYQNMVNYLSQWIKHNVSVMSDRNFPSNPVELKALYLQYLHFKESEIPLKENEKTKIKHLYKMLEVWIEFGRIQLPQGYHPNDVEKEWGKLIVAMLEREKSLRPEVDRLEMLQQIANRVQRDCVAGEDKLALARASLQSDAKRLESGIQFQNEAEVAGYLLECENLLRQQVVDIQILLDGKFYLADQLVQRVSKLRDELLALRTECSSVYSKGRTLTSEQTKIMISGITQSLNSGFSQNLNPSLSPALTPALTPGALVTPGSTLSSSLTPVLTPAMTPALTPGLQPTLVGGGNVETGVLQHLKQMQIRKPMLKSSLVDPNLSEEEVNMKFVQDLLNWVEEMQVQLDRGEWGSDLPSVESHLENHRNVHKAIEDFQMSLKEAKISEIQMTQPLKQSYSEKLGNLENQYGRLLNCSRERQKHLDSLHDFVSHATEELIWLNEKEEEEVAFDWSERNSNVSRKKDYHAELMRELDKKEGMIKSVQDQADSLLQQNHPARLTIEAYKAAMQTQWSWILQLCYCVEQHLKENTVYFEFFNDAKESMDYLKSLQDSISRKYSCDRTSGLHRLEDLIQESMDEKEQLLQYRSTVAGLVGRAKSIVQLKPRNPEYPVRTSIPVKAICDYRQIEITIYKEDECVLASNSHRAKWKVISPSGNEAMVPSVCFSVPAPNKEAVDMASRIEQLYQNVLALWHRSHINMKSVVSWHYLMMDIRTIRKSTVASIKTMLPGEHQQVLSSLQSHFEEFLEDSEESEVFTVADCAQLEREVLASKEYYEELLKSAEREEHEESVYNLFISEVRNFRMRVEAHEEQLIRHIRTPLDRDDLQASMQRINEQERKKAELDRLKEDLEVLKEKYEVFLRQAANSPSVPTLSSELSVLTQSMAQVYSMCSIYLEKLKAVSLVVKHSQSAEALVKLYEAKLCEEDAVNADIKSIDAVMSTLKQWRSEIDDRREVFHDLEDELQKARVISDRMFKTHNERDFDLDWHKEKAEQLGERWRNVHSQIENRLRDLEGISKSLRYYKDTYSSLDEWSKEMEANQLKTQENQPEDSKALAELLNQQKVLVAEIERKQSKIDECQKYSEQYSAGVKDYELQLMTYRAMVDSQHKSPVKRRRMQSSSDAIQQEFMDLRTRYTALVTLMTQYVKFASETLKRAEEDERRSSMERTEYRSWMESMELQKSSNEEEISRLRRQVLELEASLSDRQQQLDILGGELDMQKKSVEELNVQKSKAEYEAQQYRFELEGAIKCKTATEQELNHCRQLIQQSEAKQGSMEESLRMLKKNIEESTLARRKLEEHLRRKNSDVQDLEEHRRTLERELKAKEDAEVELLNQVRTMEMDLTQQSEARVLQGESRVTLTRDGMQKSTISSSVQLLHSEAEAEALQYKMDELMMGKKRAETEIKTLKSELNSVLMHKNMAEEKAQRFKELLDDANNRLMKLQVEMESDRNSNRQKSEDLRQDASELRKSVYIFQEQVKSLQRDKSSLEQRVLFHKTEVDGLKEQLKINQGKLLQRSTSEQESCQRLRCLEEELSSKQAEAEQMKFKVTELTRMNQLLEGDIRHLTVSIESFQQEKSLSEQKIKSLKNELENLKDQLQKAKDDMSIKARSEKDMQLKIKNLELELQKSDLQVTQFTKKVEELRRVNMDSERSVKNLRAELDKVNMDVGSKDQQISIFKSQVESTKSQLKIVEEELIKKTQTAHELQIKLRDYNEETKKTSELQQKVKSLTVNVANYEKEIRNLKAELTSMSMEKNLANQKVQEHKMEMNNLNMALQKESSEGKKNVAKLRELENELLRCKQTISRVSGSSEKATVNLKQDISTLQRDKQAADQKLQTLKSEFDELNSTLKKTKDELQKVTQEWKMNQAKLKDVEAELQKNRITIKEISSSSDKYTTNLQQECSNLLKQKGTAEEKVTTLAAETSQLKMKLEQTQEEVLQKQKETAAAKLRSQMLEDQLENCKRMLEDLKGKLELQKKGYETQLQLVQNEMEQKLALHESRMKLDYDRKSKERSHSAETIVRDNKQLSQEVEKLKTLHFNTMKSKQDAQHQLDSLRAQLEQSEKQKGVLDLELLKAKSKIAELETEKIKVKSSISQLDSVRKESSKETIRLKQMLTEAERKLEFAETEAKTLKEQVASYIKEVKSLQEKNLKLEVTVSSLNKQLKEVEVVNQVNHQCAKDGELAKLKTELILTQKIVSSYEDAKRNLEDELKKMKETSEIATLEKDKVLEELKKVKLDKMVTVTHRSQEEALGMTEKSSIQEKQSKQTVSSITRASVSDQTSTTRKSSLSDKGKSGKSQSVSFSVISSESSSDATHSSQMDKQSELPSTKLQGLRGRISIKKLIRTKIITQELALKLQAGLITLEEVQTSLAQFSGKPASIAGIYLESSKKKISFIEAAEAGFMAKTYAIEFLEAQAATGALIDPITGECYTALDAFEKGIIGRDLKDKITEADKAVSGYPHGGKILSVFQAMEERIVERHRGKGILEAQIATGGLIHPLIGMRVPLDCAIEQGLINQATLQTLFDPVSNPKSFHNPETGQRVYYGELLKMCVFDVSGGVYLLPFGEHHISSFSPASTHRVSVINSATGAEMSTYEAYKARLIDMRTYLFLSQQESEWQETTVVDLDGNTLHILTDQKSGRQFCIENALSLKILQTSELHSYRSGQMTIWELADLLISRKVTIKVADSPIAGLWVVALKKRLSILKGLQQNLVDRLTALKFLEAQACTGGICDPASGERVQIAEALRRGLLDESFARQLQQYEQAYYGVIHPQTGKMLTVAQAMHENLFPKDVGLRCLEYQLATGGLIDPESHNRVSAEEAIRNCLIDKATAGHLKNEHLLPKTITCPKTKRKISYKEALDKGISDAPISELIQIYKPKSVEEEKKEHACKVNKLLNWMSDMKTSQNKDGKALADDKASTESSNKQQVPVEEVLTKKEQIAEAMRSTQQILTKHSDKMTEEEKRETKEQLKSLHQAYSELSQQTGEQAPSAEQEFQVIEGILNVRSGAILSVCRSVQNGLIDQSTGLSLLEAQLITSELILPEFRMCLDLEDAFKHNLVDGPMYEQLQDLNGANRSIQEATYASEPLPVVAAVNEGAISERLAIKIIEIQLATGGLRVTYTGECLSLERAFQFGLIPHSFYVKILERQNSWKDLIDPNTAEKVSLIQLMQRSIVHEETGLRLLPVKSGKDGTISLTSGREISILRAVHEGLIDRETMIRLLSAQLFAGGIVDPKTNRKLTVEEALSEGLIDQDTASGILSHQSKNGGIVNPHNGARLTVDEAVQCDLMSSRSALLVLERQKCFMGLLWPHSGEILTVSTSVQHEIITDKLASELLCHRHKIAALYIPENSEVVDIDSATRNGLIDTYTKELLKTLEIPDTFPDVDNLNDRFSTWLVMREVQLEGSQSTSDEMEVGERSISAHSSSEFKQLFISYLMMNSYMDPKSGQRLLIFDGQLNKMAKLLLEVSDSGMNDPSQVVMHDSPVDENFSENALELHATCSKDLGIWHIEKPLTKISEETDSEISVDGADGNCVKPVATGFDRLTNWSAPKETALPDASSKYSTNYSLSTSAQPSIGMQISCSDRNDVNEVHITHSSDLEIMHIEKPLAGIPKDVNEVCITHTNDLANMHIEQPVTRIPPESGLEISTEGAVGNEDSVEALTARSGKLPSVSGEILNSSSENGSHTETKANHSALEEPTLSVASTKYHTNGSVNTLAQPSAGTQISHLDLSLDEDILQGGNELHITYTSDLEIMNIKTPLARIPEESGLENSTEGTDGNEASMESLTAGSDELASVSGEILNISSENGLHVEIKANQSTPEETTFSDASTKYHTNDIQISYFDLRNSSLDEDIPQDGIELHVTQTSDLEIMNIGKPLLRIPEDSGLEFSRDGADGSKFCLKPLTTGLDSPMSVSGEMFSNSSENCSHKAITEVKMKQGGSEETPLSDVFHNYQRNDEVSVVAQPSVGSQISHSVLYDSPLDEDIHQNLKELHISHNSDVEIMHIDKPLVRIPDESSLEISIEGAEANEDSLKSFISGSVTGEIFNNSLDDGSHTASVTEVKAICSASEETTLLDASSKQHTNTTAKTITQTSKGMQISHSELHDSSLDKDVPQDVHITHTSDLEIIHIDRPQVTIPEDSDLEMTIEVATGNEVCIKPLIIGPDNVVSVPGETFNNSAKNCSYKASVTDIKLKQSCPEETTQSDTFPNYQTNDAISTLAQPSVGIQISHPDLHHSSLDENIPQDSSEVYITHFSDLQNMDAGKTLERIPEESDLETSIEDMDENEDCMQSTGSDKLISSSGEKNNTSLDNSSCKSTSVEAASLDAFSKSLINDADHTLVQPSVEICSESATETTLLSKVDVNQEQLNHAENTGQAEEPADCSILSTEVDKNAEMTSEHPQCEVTWNDKLERAHAVHLLRGQVEEGGILDVTSGKKYDLNAAVDKGLIDEQTVLEVLALQLQQDDVVEDPAIAISVLKQAVLQGSISPQVALQIMEQQNLLGGFYDPTSGKTISVTKAWEMGPITDYLSNVVLHSEPVRKAIIDPEGKRIRNVSDAHHLGMLDDEKAENMQEERDQKLDLHGEQFSEERPSAENDVKRLEEPTRLPTDRTQMVSNLSSSLKTVSNTPFKTFAPAGIDPGKETVIDHIVHTQDSQDCQNLDLEADRNSMLFGNVTQKEAEKGGVSYIALHKVPLDRDNEAAVNLMVSPVLSNSGMSCSSESDICSGERFSLLNLSQFSESQQMARTSTSDIYSTQLKTLLSGNEDVNTIKDHQPYLSSCATSSQLAEQRASGKKSQDEQHLDLTVLPHSQNGQTNPSQCPITENSMSAKEPEHESKSDEAKSSEVLKQFQSSHVEIVDCKEHRKDSTTNVETSKLMDISQVFSRDITPVMPPLTLLPDVTLSNTEIGDTSNLQQFVEHPTQSSFQAPDEAEPAAIESKMPKLDSSSAITNRYETTVSQNVSDKIVESASDPAYDVGVQRSKSAELQPDSVLPNSSEKTQLYFNTSQNTDGVEPCSGDANPSKAQDLRKVPPKSDDRSYLSEAASENEIQRTQTEALDSIVHLIQHATQGGSSESVLQGLVESNDPDLLQDLKKHERMNTESGCGDGHEQRLPVLKQSQLLEVIQGISECKDPAVLKALLGNLSGLLASTSQSGDGTCSESTEMEATATREVCKDDVFESVLSQQPFETSSPTPENMEEDPVTPRRYSTQNYLECIGKLQDHHDALEDIRNDLLTQSPLTTDLEGLHGQLQEAQTKLESTYQDFLSRLDKLSACIEDNYEMVCKLDIMNTDDLETVKYRIQQNKDLEKNLSGTRQHLEDTAFDVQYFISEHAQFLSPAQNRQLLKSLSATQRAFKELMDRVFTQRHTLDLHLEIREDESLQQTAGEKQKEFVAKLQEMCDDLRQTENRLIGHQQQAVLAKSVGDLQQYQQEHQALQKDIQANASALNEVISSTKKFLEENRSKLTPEQITAIEVQLEEAKSKANMLNQRAEESRKDLEKVVTTAIKQETEKVAAVEQLEESKNKIEGLLDWISNIGKEKEMGGMQKDQVSKQNGNMAIDTQGKRLIGHNDDPNGNELDSTDNSPEWSGESEDSRELDLNQQYEKVKSHHQEILSQQQDLIIATQSAQALLDKQAEVLSPAEKEKLQRDIQELRSRYEASLTRAEQQIKQLQSIQEELRKFQGDSAEFESWLQHAQEQVEELGAPAGQLEVLQEKLQKQKSFYEDVISHKGDLRFITISGQKVLDVAKTCSQGESGDKEALPEVDTSGTCATVKEKLDSATARYKALHTQCNQLGTNLKDVVDKYKKYEDATGGLLTWLNNSEEEARRQLSEPIAADPQTLQRQLEDTKALQGQTTGHQTAVEMLRKIADALIAVEGDLLTNQDEIQEAVDDIVERYDNLSKSVSDRNEKLQVTLTRSLSVQDGLDEMMNWMEKVEESLEKEAQVPLDSDTIADALSKEAALEQDISSRQSSISTMKAKVKKFAETAEPAAAALLQTKMEGLSQRFTDACEKHKKKVSQMEQLKEKVEQFEKTSEKVQQFVLKRSQALCETDGPGKNVNELSQLVQDTNEELAEHVKDMETLQMLSKELSSSGLEGSKALIQGKMANLSNTFNAFRETIKEKEEEVSSCQDQLGDFKAAAGVLMKWLEETKEQVPAVQPNCSEQSLGNDLHKVNGLLEEWTTKAPAVQDINSKGSALCSLISVLTSPAKAKMHHKSVTNGSGPGGHAYLTSKELMLVQQNMSCVSEGYRNLGDLLKGRSSELNALLHKVRGAHDEAESMLQWLEDMKKTAASWSSEPTVKDSVKTQMEQQKAYEENMKRKQQQYQELREKVLHLIEENPDSPEAAKWKHMLDQIDAGWKEVVGSVENRKQHLEESSRVLELFQTTQTQLSQWLQEKELMMSVLGPLSMDPNMLNTQKQQVQILLKEFEGRKPQYEQLNEAAVAITSTSGKQDPAVEKVKEKVVAITQKWQGLTGQLSQRDALIEQAVGKTTQYQELLRRLGESAAVLESQLGGQQALSTQPDAVKKQLEDTNAILSQLCEEKKRLKEAERLCSELSNLVTEEYLKANLTKQLESVSKPFKLLEDKAGKRIRQLNSAFASSQQFHQMSKNFQDWLDQKLQEQAEPQSISAKVETLSENLKEHSAVQRALSEHEESYSTIMKEGEALLQSTEGAEKVALQGQLSVLKSNWEEVKRSAAEREEKLNTVMERAQKYKEHAENLSSWLKECDERQNKVKFSVNPVEVDNSLSQVKAIQKDVDKHRGQMELLSTASDSLLEVATEDVDAVKEEKAVIGKNLDKLAEDLQLKKESLDKLSQRLREFSDTHKELKSQLEGSKKQLESHSSLGVQAYSNKNLTNMKAQQTSLEAVQTQVEHLKSLAQSLVVDVPDTEGVTDLLLQADSLEKEYSSISKAVEDACSTLEDKLQGIGQFQNTIREMFTSFADFDDELDSMAPVGRDLETLRHQQGAIQSFISKLQDLMTNTASARDKCKKMLESEASPDLLGLKRDLEALSKQSGKLMDRANGRKEQVEDTLKHLEEFYSKLQTFTQKMTGAEEQEESQGPVGMETDVINQQLETFKFRILGTSSAWKC